MRNKEKLITHKRINEGSKYYPGEILGKQCTNQY